MEIESLAIVLRRFDFSETSQVAHLFTLTEGRISVMARGARRPSSGLRGPIDCFHLARIRFRRRARADMDLLTRYVPLTGFPGLRENLERLYAAFYIAELVHAGTQDRDRSPELFEVLRHGLEALEGARSGRCREPVLATALGYLRATGLDPAIERCGGCGKEPGRRLATFYPAHGGVLCRQCRPAAAGVDLDSGDRAALSDLRRGGPEGAGVLTLPEKQRRRLSAAILASIRAVLDRRPRSEPFLLDSRSGYAIGKRAPLMASPPPRTIP